MIASLSATGVHSQGVRDAASAANTVGNAITAAAANSAAPEYHYHAIYKFDGAQIHLRISHSPHS